MPTNAFNVISELQDISWNGLPSVPCKAAPYNWGYRLVERAFAYVDGSGHDETGRTPIRFRATLMFMNSLQDGAYPDLWEAWRAMLIREGGDNRAGGAAGDLIHPDLGKIRARVASVDVDLDSASRSGIKVDVEWVETLEDIPPKDLAIDKIKVDIFGTAAELDDKYQKLNLSYPSGMSHQTALGLVRALKGSLNMIEVAATGVVNQLGGNVQQLTSLATADFWKQNAVERGMRIWAAMKEQAEGIKSTAKQVVDPNGAETRAGKRKANIAAMREDMIRHKASAEEASQSINTKQVSERAAAQSVVDLIEILQDDLLMKQSAAAHQLSKINPGSKDKEQMKKSQMEHDISSAISSGAISGSTNGSAAEKMSAALAAHYIELGIGSVTLDYPDTLDHIGELYNNSIGDMLTLNPPLMGLPQIPAGQVVYYYLDK